MHPDIPVLAPPVHLKVLSESDIPSVHHQDVVSVRPSTTADLLWVTHDHQTCMVQEGGALSMKVAPSHTDLHAQHMGAHTSVCLVLLSMVCCCM